MLSAVGQFDLRCDRPATGSGCGRDFWSRSCDNFVPDRNQKQLSRPNRLLPPQYAALPSPYPALRPNIQP